MRRMKATILSLALALMLFVNVALYKPSDHEAVSESPTESSQMIPPADDVAPLAPSPKPIQPPVTKAEAKAESKPVVKAVNKPAVKPVKQAEAKTQVFTATFFTANCRGCTGVTANGTSVKRSITRDGYRVIAADRSIPFGTKMRITLEDGTVINGIVDDRGGKIRGKLLDILVASYDEAIRLGRQKVTVQILN